VDANQMHAASRGGPAGAAIPTTQSVLPDRYGLPEQSGLQATVTAGGANSFDFDLTP
jgi:hypothetical protein